MFMCDVKNMQHYAHYFVYIRFNGETVNVLLQLDLMYECKSIKNENEKQQLNVYLCRLVMFKMEAPTLILQLQLYELVLNM